MATEKEILHTLQERPEQGFRLLMATYKEPIYWHIRRLVVSHDDAQDATQETFVRVFRSLPQFEGKGSLGAWIYRIATNEALRLRMQRQEEVLPLEQAEAALNGMMADSYVDYSDLEAIRLQKAILSLPAKQQVAFNLRYYDELSYDEIAEISGSTPASAKMNYHLAKERIRQYIQSHD